jgi:Raf kinase inhibitor-like YbhB/YbcL family protein
MKLASDSFRNRSAIPAPHAHSEGGNLHPQLRWSEVPAGVSSLALLCMDADAPADGADVLHWSVVDIPPGLHALAAGALPCAAQATLHGVPLRQGRNDFGGHGYQGPMPPPHHKHHYIFRLYALDVPRLALPADFTCADVLDAMYGHIVDEAQLIGTYQRN